MNIEVKSLENMENCQRNTTPSTLNQKNIIDIMEQGLQLRREVKTMREQFVDLLEQNQMSTPVTIGTKSCSDPIYTLLKRASDQLQSPMLGTNVLNLRKHTGTPVKPRTVVATTPVPSLAGKRKCSTTELLQVPKMQRYDTEEECRDNDINENKENGLLSDAGSVIKKSKRRRSSLKRFLTPKRRRSSDGQDSHPVKMPRMGVRAKLAGFTSGVLPSKSQGCTNAQDSENDDLPKEIFEPVMSRPQTEGSEIGDSMYQHTVLSLNNDTIKTAELSSYNYSNSPTTFQFQEITRTMRPPLKEAIKNVAGQFLPNDTGKSVVSTKKVSVKPKNRINVSDLLSDSDVSDLKCREVLASSSEDNCVVKAEAVDNDKSFNDISKLSDITQSHHQTMREQMSMTNIMVPGALHSTFNYPLHSTMSYPLSSTICNNLDNPREADLPELDLDESQASDCDSSVMSIDVDDVSFAADENVLSNCDVCKVMGLRRQMAQPKLEARRRPPVGLSETDIQFECKFPRGRLPPVGASQSFLDADQTIISNLNFSTETADATIGSIPDFSSLTELNDTVVPNQESMKKCSDSSSSSSKRSSKARRRTKAVEIDLEDKENMNFFHRGNSDAKRRASRSRPSSEMLKTPLYPDCSSDYSITSSLDNSHKKLLKQKMKSFNASQRSSESSGVATLGFF